MLNKFCFHLYAQKSLLIVENVNAFFDITLSTDIRVHRAGSQLKIEELSSTHYHHPYPILHLLCYKYYFWVYCSIVLLFLCSCEFWQQCYYRLSQMENKTSLSLIVGLSCQFNRLSFINVYWIILNDRLSFWLFIFFLDPYHMTNCTLKGRVWLPSFGTMCWVIRCIQCHMTHGKVLYTVHHMILYNTSYSTVPY